MVRIAVISKNRCSFERMEEFALPLLYKDHTLEERKQIKNNINNYIWSVVEPYVKFIDIEDNDFMTVVCNQATECFSGREPDQFFYHTEGSYSFPKKYMEIIYCQPLWNDYKDGLEENINNLGCYFSIKHSVVENNCIILANNYDLSAPKFVVPGSVTKEDIIRVVRRRFFFSATLIKDDTVVKYYYQNPAYLVSSIFGLTENDNIQKLAVSHLKYNLVFYFQHDKTKYINKIATRINGAYRLHGDVLMLHELEENVYANLSIREAKRLNVLSYGRLYDRRINENENHTIDVVEVDEKGNEVEKKKVPFWSRYIIVEKRMLEWKEKKNKCINCDKEIKKLVICEMCYRVKFCSDQCRQEFGSYHTDECINPKSL
jgi:hypothetical protein